MLRAHAGTSSSEFIAQLRTFVIALGLSPLVVDQVDKLTDVDELEAEHAAELIKDTDNATKDGRESMKTEILEVVNKWLENQPNYNMIAAPCEAMITEIEKIELE